MNEPIIISLIQNIAVLLAFAMLYENFWLRNDKPRGIISKIFTGLIVGLIGIVLMFTPWRMTPGLVFDSRSVMLGISGIFFGPLPTVIAMVLSGIVRFYIGGEGLWMGLAVIVSSGTIGIVWAELRKKWKRTNQPIEFFALGLVIHVVMLAATVLLPDDRMSEILRIIILPIFLIYIPGTMLLGLLMAAQKRNFQNQIEKEKLYLKEHSLQKELLEKQQQLTEQLEKYTQLNKEYRSQNFELKSAKEKAEESDRLKSAFLANLSHEIRTPMNAIIGFADLLNLDELDDKTRENYTQIIKNSGNYLLSIINDIVEISHIEAGQVELNDTEFDPGEFLDDVYSTFKVSVPAKKNLSIKLVKDESRISGKIKMDEIKLRQILMNLLNNALKFTEKGEICFGYEISDNAEITFFVRDTGIGIAPENQQFIFERFRQIDKGKSKINSGSGLGLSITKAYVDLMGGTIKLNSDLGKGSEFNITFPYFQHNSAPKRIKREEIAQPTPANGKKVIVVAEDEDINWYYIEQILSRYNYNLIRAENGKEAVDLCLENENVDLVLLDIKMPVMDGYEALEKIRSINPKLPVIAQTAYALPGDVEKIKTLFDDYITKPINRQLLIEKIAVAKASYS
ncbi:LytS/YhcK type 5TM receptor domain-containing protein [Mariniphaga sp.]|uniref:LytS/YhcK type 5TM receptor domain-containing protein n=1 Tax=Mariniphaga sp. TaxID=1954475 RepID=UPI00356A82F5